LYELPHIGLFGEVYDVNVENTYIPSYERNVDAPTFFISKLDKGDFQSIRSQVTWILTHQRDDDEVLTPIF